MLSCMHADGFEFMWSAFESKVPAVTASGVVGESSLCREGEVPSRCRHHMASLVASGDLGRSYGELVIVASRSAPGREDDAFRQMARSPKRV